MCRTVNRELAQSATCPRTQGINLFQQQTSILAIDPRNADNSLVTHLNERIKHIHDWQLFTSGAASGAQTQVHEQRHAVFQAVLRQSLWANKERNQPGQHSKGYEAALSASAKAKLLECRKGVLMKKRVSSIITCIFNLTCRPAVHYGRLSKRDITA
jgi:hypothetical protein